jgi:hypothetical protein
MPTKVSNIILTDAEEQNKRHPDTFKILPRLTRDNLQPGQYAKLCFHPGPEASEIRAERMWVLIRTRTPTNDGVKYVGELNNDPVAVPIKCGDTIHFGPQHVLQALDGEGDSL